MHSLEIFSNLSLIDIMLIGSAALFFSTAGVFAGLMQKRMVTWSVIAVLILLGVLYRDEIYFQWLVFTSNR